MKKIYLLMVAVLATMAVDAATEPAWYNDVTSIAANGQYYIYSVNGKGFMQAGQSKVKAVNTNNYNTESGLIFTITKQSKGSTYNGSYYLSAYSAGTNGPVSTNASADGCTISWENKSSYWNIYSNYKFIWDQTAYLLYKDNSYSATALTGDKTDVEYQWYVISTAHYDRHWAIFLYEKYKETDVKDYTKYEGKVPADYYAAMHTAFTTTFDVTNAAHSAEVVKAVRKQFTDLYNDAEAVSEAYTAAKATINALDGLKDKGEGDLTEINNDITAARNAIEQAMSVTALETATSAPNLKAIDPIAFQVTEFTALQPLGTPASTTNGRAITYAAADNKIINAEGLPIYKGTTKLTATAAATNDYYEFVRSETVTVLAINNTGEDGGSVCEGSTFTYEGAEYAAGTHEVTLVNRTGGDSVVTLTVSARPVYNTTDGATICASELPYTWQGETFTAAGVITKTLTSSVDCDSTVTFTLTVNQESAFQEDLTIAYGDQVTWNGYDLSELTVGNHEKEYTTQNAAGCDSVVTLKLTITKMAVLETQTDLSFCANDSVEYREVWYKEGGEFAISAIGEVRDTLINVVIAKLETDYIELPEAFITAGESVTWKEQELVLEAAGDTTLVDSLLNLNGCDSVVVFEVHVSPAIPSGVSNTAEKVQCEKVFRDGQLYILRGKELFDVTGRKQD